jgi:hypothetical protein
MNIQGKCTLVKVACYNGTPSDRVEIHPGKGYRVISIVDGAWYQTTELSRAGLYLKLGVRLSWQLIRS